MHNIKTKLLRVGILAAAVAISGISCQSPGKVQAAGDENAANVQKDLLLTPGDQNFMRKAEDMDIKERNLGRVIMQRSHNADVRDYAKMLADDHSQDLRRAVDLMEGKGIRQPQNMPEVKHEALTELDNLSGPALDRAFADVMVKDHQADVALFTQEVRSGEDPAVRDYAARTLLTLQEHLKKAQELQNKLDQSSGR